MDAQFTGIVERLAREKGRAVLIDAAKCRGHLADYAHNAFKKERHLLLIAIEAGAGKEIARASDLAICKKQLIRFLNEERFIDETLASEAIDLLAFVLRGDRAESLPARHSGATQAIPPQPPQPPAAPGGNTRRTQAPSAPPRVEYVGFWARVCASIVDIIVLAVIGFAIGFVLSFILAFSGYQGSMNEKEIDALWDILGWVIGIVYTLGFWTKRQATPGKMAVRARIVDARTLGKPSMGQFVGRYLAYMLSALPLCLGFLWVAFDEQKRGWHDKLAGTLVVRA
jgi:uncharacterized RDD family membrane protein YckC